RSANVIGTEGINKGLDELLTKKCKAPYVHEIERRLLIAEEIGVKKNDGLMEIFLTEKEKLQAKNLLEDLDLKGKTPLIGIHPGSKDLFKRWKEKHFIELGRKLVKEKKGKIVITGDHHEKELGQLIANKIPGAHSLAGKISLRILAALLGELHLFITNDTGPMHLAFAMNTPTLALFAPTDPHLCGPYKAKRNVIIYKGLTCSPCLRKKCGEPFCMEQINVDEVWEKIHVLLPS
ncbi:MAG: glycosyltransferase family 9 protein, partial [Simkania negevensis]|nr:glycosyltransferase family 9 protein [Simkania negevensis]